MSKVDKKKHKEFVDEARRIMKKYKCGSHQVPDYKTKEENIDKGFELCERCVGTGNELFSMYRRCSDCNGTGKKTNKSGDTDGSK